MESMPLWFLALLALLGIFILGREVLCWYWKVNKSIDNQEVIIKLLQQLVEKKNNENNN